MDFHEVLRHRRLELGISQAAPANAAGVDRLATLPPAEAGGIPLIGGAHAATDVRVVDASSGRCA
jgi:hypothetical protein